MESNTSRSVKSDTSQHIESNYSRSMESDTHKTCARCNKTLSEVFNEWEHETEDRCMCELPTGSKAFQTALGDLTTAKSNDSSKDGLFQKCSHDEDQFSSSPSSPKLCGRFRWVCFGKFCIRQPVAKTRSQRNVSWT